MKIRVSGIVKESITDGEGMRTTVFFQGCPHHCEGCHNPSTWSYDGGYEIEVSEVIEMVVGNPIIQGVTFSGGEPLSERNYEGIKEIIKGVKARGKDVWMYTGYVLEDLKAKEDKEIEEILEGVDVLVDGPFILSQKNLELHFRGSENQRVIKKEK